MKIPKATLLLQETEDLDLLQITIDQLFNQFIKPIDSIRSQSLPSILDSKSNKNDFTRLEVSNNEIFESRCHAFYRMLSLPVAAGNAIYNPGFIPNYLKNNNNYENVRNLINQNYLDLYNFSRKRENKIRENKNIFIKQDLRSSLYALLLKYPLQINILSDDKQPFEIDEQKFTISDRILEIEKITESNQSIKEQILQASAGLQISQKILKPFVVDPKIETTVMPDYFQVCAPFLPSKNSCQIQKNIFLNRPGIELIIRQRLSNSYNNTLFLKQIESIISKQNIQGIDISNLSSFSIIDSLAILSEKNQLSNSTRDLFKNFTGYQLNMINQLTKYLKFCIKKLVDSISIIDHAKFQIYWLPIPSVDGPITGPIGAKISPINLQNTNVSMIEQKILELKIKKLNSEKENIISEDIGFFASPFQNSTSLEDSKFYQDEIDSLEKKKNQISNSAFVALSHIEMICGEISGLGLIDILSIYLTLWSIDINTLINFLDNDSFERMCKYNPQFLSITEVQNRKNGAIIEYTDVLRKFESTLYNIFSYLDKIYQAYFYENINN